ncbi:MAG: hypothetical protein ACU843_08990 [Gammaproteobacteria bacterium]
MQNWIESEFFGYWKDAQTRITRCLTAQDRSSDNSGRAGDLHKPGVKLLCRWGESVVRQSLDLQAKWIDLWIRQSGHKSTDLQSFSEQVRLINRAMQDWSGIQDQLWKFWFGLMDSAIDKTGTPDPSRARVEIWKKVIKESEADLKHWFTKWEEQIHCKPLVPEALNRLIDKLGQEMLGWIQNQAVLWQYGFNFVNAVPYLPPDLKALAGDIPEPVLARDKLTEISGIGPVIEQLLNARNIVSFRQIAELSQEEIRFLEENVIRLPTRIRREEWIHEAKELCARD